MPIGNVDSRTRGRMIASLLVWLLPHAGLKIWLLRRLGHVIGNDVHIGPIVVMNCGRFELADRAIVGPLNIFRNLAVVRLGEGAYIGQLNQFTAAPAYQAFSDRAGCLLMSEQTGFTNRHYVDCSGQVILRPYGFVGGVRTIIQSHQLDLARNETTVGKIVIDEDAITLTGCVLLKDAWLPPRSVLGANSLLMKFHDEGDDGKPGLYAGHPAKFVHPVSDLSWWKRDQWMTSVTEFDDSDLEPLR